MFTRYANYLDQETTRLYQMISTMQAEILETSNKFNGVSKQIAVKTQTAPISMPTGIKA